MTTYTKNSDAFSETRIDDEIVLMRLDTGDFLSLKHTAVDIWELLDTPADRDAIVQAMAARYAVDPDFVVGDVDAFLASLSDAGLIGSEG